MGVNPVLLLLSVTRVICTGACFHHGCLNKPHVPLPNWICIHPNECVRQNNAVPCPAAVLVPCLAAVLVPCLDVVLVPCPASRVFSDIYKWKSLGIKTLVMCLCAENGTDGLEFTRLWLRRNFEKLLAAEKETAAQESATSSTPPAATTAQDITPVSSSPLPSSSSQASAPSKATPANILNEAYIETLCWDHNNIYPEVAARTHFTVVVLWNPALWTRLMHQAELMQREGDSAYCHCMMEPGFTDQPYA